MTREFNVVIERDEDGYFVASVPELRNSGDITLISLRGE